MAKTSARFTDPDRHALELYIRQEADHLGLKDWTIELDDDDPIEDALASIYAPPGQKRAFLSLDKEFRTWEPKKQRHAIIHELIHLHFEAMHKGITRFAESSTSISEDLANILDGVTREGLEYGVDGLAMAIAVDAPFIEWPKPKEKKA